MDRALHIVQCSDPIEDDFDGPWNDTSKFTVRVGFDIGTHHRIRLTTARLPVGKDRSVESLEYAIDDR